MFKKETNEEEVEVEETMWAAGEEKGCSMVHAWLSDQLCYIDLKVPYVDEEFGTLQSLHKMAKKKGLAEHSQENRRWPLSKKETVLGRKYNNELEDLKGAIRRDLFFGNDARELY